MLDGGAGDDQPVELLGLHLLEGAVEGRHVLGGGVLRRMLGHADQVQVDLQGRRRSAGRTGFRSGSSSASVQKPDPQGPDVLMRGAVGDMTMTPSFRSTSRRAGQGDGHGRVLE
jgi:hypothetical protein